MKPAEAEIRQFCLDYLATLLDMPVAKIDPDAKMVRLGMDSALMISLVMALESWLSIELEPDIVVDHPTVAELARHLADLGAGEPRDGRSATR